MKGYMDGHSDGREGTGGGKDIQTDRREDREGRAGGQGIYEEKGSIGNVDGGTERRRWKQGERDSEVVRQREERTSRRTVAQTEGRRDGASGGGERAERRCTELNGGGAGVRLMDSSLTQGDGWTQRQVAANDDDRRLTTTNKSHRVQSDFGFSIARKLLLF